MGTKVISVRLEDELVDKLRALAEADRRPLSTMIALLLERAVEEKK